MMSFAPCRLLAIAIVCVLATDSISHAVTWTGLATPDNLWATSGNWDSGVPGSGTTAQFTDSGNGNTTISLGGAVQPIGSISFDTANVAAYTLGQQPGDTSTSTPARPSRSSVQ